MLRTVIIALTLTIAATAEAQSALPPQDALAKCVAENTTGKDRKEFAKYFFFALAAHPDMKPYVSEGVAGAANENARAVAALVLRLFTQSCLNEARAVIRSGDVQGMNFAGQGFGTLAFQELLADKAVQEAAMSAGQYIDQKRLSEALLTGK